MTERGIELIKRFEGFSPVVYICPAGYPTIGYGHVVRSEEREFFSSGITEQQAEELLLKDLIRFEIGVRKLIQRELHDYAIDALVSFAYNVGLYAFRASTLRRKILRGDLLDGAAEFLKWVYAGGRKLQGLVRRRQAERELYLEGISYGRL